MNLKTKIEQQIKKAMLNKDKDRLRALRSIKSEILLAETKTGKTSELGEEIEMKLLTKAAKQRKDAITLYDQQNRKDLADTERAELLVIESFLPKQLSNEEIQKIIEKIILEVNATHSKDMGKVMGMATKKLSGQAEGKIIAQITKKLLS